ncbi:UbiX family flavin prenyltransferase [Telmatospirillum sp.]|uniref:UbiX family flavin prenyltransferase n=1 Tax=Telmatospirillum sp. TaxID=2079197 RepID=UPI00283AF27C|nr:UbiX family flavin prenyltransferase [Telmatospirillum sp.]MDR3437371.1 UbiX family flavin prenyltransferase [Telmatospirillum sp.]
MDHNTAKRLVVAITGATGACFGVRILEALRELGVETHLIISSWGEVTIGLETNLTISQVKGLASCVHAGNNQAAIISSGSFQTDGMVIAPCSMKTLAAIRVGYADGLIARAADVILKERRKLVLLAREAPLSEIHLENMLALTRMGATIMPPVPAFYNKPQSIGDIIDTVVGRTLDQFGLEMPTLRRWAGLPSARQLSFPGDVS